jgi:HEAT repeat protein
VNKILLSGLACAAMLLGTPESLRAHGGQYRGPGDVVPPNPGGGGSPKTPGPGGPSTPGPGGPSTPGPSGPSTPGPSGPATGGPSAPSGKGGPTTGPRGIQLDDDLTRWLYWWEFNKDPFIRLKDAIHSGGPVSGSDDVFFGASRRVESKNLSRPSDTDKKDRILPKLKEAIDQTDQRDITSSCMVAMAKLGMDHDSFKIQPIFEARLKSRDQEIRETAALALGISQMAGGIDSLLHLVSDSPEGRKLVDRSEVDDRTRTFACYGTGLVAWAVNDVDVKRKAFEALKAVLEDERVSSRNVQVGAINGIRLIRPDTGTDEKQTKLRDDAIATLWAFYEKKLGQGQQMIQAHVPPAIATLLGRTGDKAGKYKDAFAKELTGDAKRANEIYQSAALALGAMAQPAEIEKGDAKYSAALQKYFDEGKDLQARYFSLVALGQIGGDDNRNFLLKTLERGKEALEKPWAAMGLGVMTFNRNKAEGANASPDRTVGEALRRELNDSKTPDAIASTAVGLGLCKYLEAQDDLLRLLEKNKKNDELAGYLTIGLALMGADRAKEDLRELVRSSVRRPELLKQAAISLGKLGDKEVADILQGLLQEDDQNLGKLSAIASALGFIGDRRSIDPLIKMLFDGNLTELSRAFAAVALGGIADKEDLPWGSKIAVDLNYRAAVETLTDKKGGILDIL